MTDNKVENVVIVGGGTAGWMTAASLVKSLGKTVNFTLVESSDIGTIGVGEATIATIRRFYADLGMSDSEVIKATAATCKLGIEFKNWYTEDSSFFQPFGLFGQDLGGVGFHHYWNKVRQTGDMTDIGDYSLGVTLAKHGKFTTPSPNPPSTLSIFDWALHFDASLFAKHLRAYAEGMGVKCIDAKIEDVNLCPENGFIASVCLEGGAEISGDLFIDCSGFRALLIEKTLQTGFVDWSEWLQCDRAVAVQSELNGEPAPYTCSTAHKAGWQWNIPLQHRCGNGHVYASHHISDDEAAHVLTSNIKGKLLDNPRMFKFIPGRREKAWNKNCIAVGLSSGFLEPLESTSIALVETAIERIKLLFPDKSMSQGCIDEFNDMARLEYERVRDFIILHYHATGRDDSPLWAYCRNMSIPETLAHKIKLYKERGHLVKYRWEIFQPASWVALYSGNNIVPEAYDPRVDKYELEYLKSSFATMKKALQDAVGATPTHGNFIADNCAISNNA
ncbi:tryptophan halogenase family protein [Teredinibacter haidensis]|uniref:tryptophan halogenase family protein n=1 Tax=Teredinibacter haidensis TaxID=2731755 RepID=UPI000948F7AB|nr:tryptophan halogenase family protein [Teredinibacter haidensis]